jgi:hypothetical protein
MAYSIQEVINEIGQISCNRESVQTNGWYAHLKNEKGKIQINAVVILDDIVKWYLPSQRYDIKTGKQIVHGKKFEGDLLQISYKYLNEKFGFSECQSRNALRFLEKKGLIFREYRNIVIDRCALNNVMHIGVYPEKIREITTLPQEQIVFTCKTTASIFQQSEQSIAPTQIQESTPIQTSKSQTKDWTAKYTEEQKTFLDYLLNIVPVEGPSIERNTATWWIRTFGIEKIKTALEVYRQRVEMAKKDPTIPTPRNIGKYMRKALNDEILPVKTSEVDPETLPHPCSEKTQQVVQKIAPGDVKNVNTNTYMTSLTVNEITDKREPVTFQKKGFSTNAKEVVKKSDKSVPTPKLTQSIETAAIKKSFKKSTKTFDWTSAFSSEENKFLAYLLRIKPEKGDFLEEKRVKWWIKDFGIDKIKIALQVYWQQVEKSKKDPKVPLPQSMGAYVKDALKKGTQPCREMDRRNKAFAESFKQQMGWSTLKITEKYCRAEEMGKEWYYNLPEVIFQASLRTTFENYCDYGERKCSIA